MPYEIFQWCLGTGTTRQFTLRGTGEHEGTNLTLSPREIYDAATWIEQRLRLENSDYRERSHSLLLDRPPPDERLSRGVAEFLDTRFLIAHSLRLNRERFCDFPNGSASHD